MHERLFPLLFLFALAETAMPTEPPTVDAQVQDLVRVLRVEAIVEGSNRHTFLNNPRMRALAEPLRSCMAGADMSFFNDLYHSIRQGRANLDAPALLEEADAAGEPSEEEMRQIEEYRRSPLAACREVPSNRY